MRSDWDEIKDSIMLEIVRIKFNSHKDLADKLLATEDKILIEGNTWHDKYWGICYCEKCNGEGKNVLGGILMQVRSELRSHNNG